MRRSLEWLGPERKSRFELLAIYPPGAAITQPMVGDLWGISQNVTWKEIRLLVRAGLAQPVRKTGSRSNCTTSSPRGCITRAAGPAMPATSRSTSDWPGFPCSPTAARATSRRDRAEWLAYHLVAAGDWDRLEALPSLRWRSAFLVATGSDAAFLPGWTTTGTPPAMTTLPAATLRSFQAEQPAGPSRAHMPPTGSSRMRLNTADHHCLAAVSASPCPACGSGLFKNW